jgi:hypothetical protein
VVADVAVPDASLHIDPDVVGVADASLLPQGPCLGSCPERVSFSASSYGISVPSAQSRRVVLLIVRTASSTRPSAR